jgi:hypothetical protein
MDPIVSFSDSPSNSGPSSAPGTLKEISMLQPMHDPLIEFSYLLAQIKFIVFEIVIFIGFMLWLWDKIKHDFHRSIAATPTLRDQRTNLCDACAAGWPTRVTPDECGPDARQEVPMGLGTEKRIARQSAIYQRRGAKQPSTKSRRKAAIVPPARKLP